MFGVDKTRMVSPDEALPGRDTEFEVSLRHAKLGTPLKGPWPDGYQTIFFGMGCFWGAEQIFWQTPGVYSTAVGYMGGWTPNPTYQEVCSAQTGHAETVQVVYDPQELALDALFGNFWENHDPTTPHRQGNDVGTQYRSAIFTTNDAQQAAAEASRDRYQALLAEKGFGVISTQICRDHEAGDGRFYYAEDYHQGYLYKNPGGYCNHGFCQVSYA